MVVKSAILPDLHQDIPLGLAPLVTRDTSENNNDRLAALGKHVLEMAVMQGLFSRRPCITGDEMEVCGLYTYIYMPLMLDSIEEENRYCV